MELNAVTARLLTLLQTQQLTGAQALQQIIDEMKHPKPRVVIDGGRNMLADLRRRDVVLGTRPLNPAALGTHWYGISSPGISAIGTPFARYRGNLSIT